MHLHDVNPDLAHQGPGTTAFGNGPDTTIATGITTGAGQDNGDALAFTWRSTADLKAEAALGLSLAAHMSGIIPDGPQSWIAAGAVALSTVVAFVRRSLRRA